MVFSFNKSMGVDINTAVDSLVKLVQKKGMIAIEEAAKELGIPSPIVNEWSIFLEEEGIIGIEYKMTTPYLVYKKNLKPYQREQDILRKKLSLLLLSVQGKVPKTKKGEMQRDFLVVSIQNLMGMVEMLNPSNKDKLINEIKDTVHKKYMFDQSLKQGA